MSRTKTSRTGAKSSSYRWVAALMVTLGVLGATPRLVTGNWRARDKAAGSGAERRQELRALLSERWDYTMRTNPEWASVLGDKRFNDKSSDVSEKAVFADLEEQKKFLKRFEAVDTIGFPEQETLNKTLMVRNIRLQLEGSRFKEWEMPVTQ